MTFIAGVLVGAGVMLVMMSLCAVAAKLIKSIPSAEPLVRTCNGCRHVGTYDTDFPCSVCIRREKDYYEQER